MRVISLWLLLAVGVLPTTALRGDDAADAFLDQPFPASIEFTTSNNPAPDGHQVTSWMLGVPSFWKGMESLSVMSGEPVLLRAGLGEWPEERSETNWQGGSLGTGDPSTVRELFERVCFSLGMVWRFDAGQDTITLDPRWWRDDARSAREQVAVLLEKPPVSWTKLPWGARNRIGGLDSVLDDWRLAFDALLSRPENLSSAGTLRLYHDSHGHSFGLSPTPVTNLYTGKISDSDGHRQVIVLNGQMTMFSKENAGDVAYYLFDEDGRFTRGGVFAVAEKQQGSILQIGTVNDRDLTVVFGLGRLASSVIYLHFVLSAGDLTLRSSTDDKGTVRDALQSQTAFPHLPEGLIRQKFSVSAKGSD